MKKLPIGIVGIGMVGGQLKRYFEEARGYVRGADLFVYDTDAKKQMRDDMNKAEVVFLCVPTPATGTGGACDTSALESALGMLRESKVVVVKSTVTPGTTEGLQKRYPRHTFLFNPEFLTESRAWEDTIRPDRQIVGGTAASQQHGYQVLSLLPQAYFSSPGSLGAYTYVRVNATEAELGKYASNIFGALKVTYANMLSDICMATENVLAKKNYSVSVSYDNIRAMMAHDGRIGDAWLNVEHNLYRGFGGACFPKDVRAFRARAKELLRTIPRTAAERKRFEKLVKLFDAVWEYNEALLASQGLTVEDVSIHDREWLEKKLKTRNRKRAIQKKNT
jgi:nucleotide sugar dehydrogenase